MALNNLLVPNVYDLFCNSITEANPEQGNTAVMTTIINPAQALVVQPAITLTGMTIRGVSVPVSPSLAPPITFITTTSGDTRMVTMLIPAFQITAQTGPSTIQFIQVCSSLPASLLPLYNTEWAITFQYTGAPIFIEYGTLALNTDGSIVFSAPQTTPITPIGPAPYGLVGDIYVTYAAAVTP